MKTHISIVVSTLILFIVSGCQTKRGTNEVDIVIKTFSLDTSCIYYKQKFKNLTIVSLIDSDSLVFNYVLMHSKDKIDTSDRSVDENITFLRKKDSLFRVIHGVVAYPLIYPTDTLKMYLGQMNGSSNESWRVNEYKRELIKDDRRLSYFLNYRVNKKKRTFNIFRSLSKNRQAKNYDTHTFAFNLGYLYIEGDSCDIVNSKRNGRISLRYYCTDKYSNTCSIPNDLGHRKSVLQLEGLLLKHIYMVQQEGVVIKLLESTEKIENPYEVAKFLISRAYYHLPEDKSIHRLTYE